jgi:hypothetical protein
VTNTIKFFLLTQIQQLWIIHIQLDKRYFRRQILYPIFFERYIVVVIEIINRDHLMTIRDQTTRQRISDKTCPSGYEIFHSNQYNVTLFN